MLLLEGFGGLSRVVVSPAERFGDDLVDETEFFQMVGGDLQSFGRVRCRRPILPQNSSTPFRADDGVVGVLEDQHAICHTDPCLLYTSDAADDLL